MNTGDFCNHCFICGASDHCRNSCPKENPQPENGEWLQKRDNVQPKIATKGPISVISSASQRLSFNAMTAKQ